MNLCVKHELVSTTQTFTSMFNLDFFPFTYLASVIQHALFINEVNNMYNTMLIVGFINIDYHFRATTIRYRLTVEQHLSCGDLFLAL